MDSFYVTLPSNSSMATYPDNALSHYSVNLPSALSFMGEWEVCLAEITYTRRWLIIVEGHNHIYCDAEETEGGVHIPFPRVSTSHRMNYSQRLHLRSNTETKYASSTSTFKK